MNFNSYFRVTSYATVAAAALALFVAGGVGVWLALAFALVMIAAWKLEDTRGQLSERIALGVILVSLPIFYLDWRILTPYLQIEFLETGQRANAEVTVLAHLILFLSAVKLLQRKADRDWFFLYLISFFEVLLAAGLTARPAFLATLILYLLCALSTVVAFEIQKARGKVTATQTRLLVPPDSMLFRRLPMRLWRRRYLETRRLPLISLGLLVLIVALALPFFLVAPRTASSALIRRFCLARRAFLPFGPSCRFCASIQKVQFKLGRTIRNESFIQSIPTRQNRVQVPFAPMACDTSWSSHDILSCRRNSIHG